MCCTASLRAPPEKRNFNLLERELARGRKVFGPPIQRYCTDSSSAETFSLDAAHNVCCIFSHLIILCAHWSSMCNTCTNTAAFDALTVFGNNTYSLLLLHHSISNKRMYYIAYIIMKCALASNGTVAPPSSINNCYGQQLLPWAISPTKDARNGLYCYCVLPGRGQLRNTRLPSLPKRRRRRARRFMGPLIIFNRARANAAAPSIGALRARARALAELAYSAAPCFESLFVRAISLRQGLSDPSFFFLTPRKAIQRFLTRLWGESSAPSSGGDDGS